MALQPAVPEVHVPELRLQRIAVEVGRRVDVHEAGHVELRHVDAGVLVGDCQPVSRSIFFFSCPALLLLSLLSFFLSFFHSFLMSTICYTICYTALRSTTPP